ncbi:hypothetical protein LJC54_00150 [Parabacteroides sp. OttesenSCG-928-J18]|nr:hypothetical protein [Parabacteroides sp. OttesenSCG-928-J18]
MSQNQLVTVLKLDSKQFDNTIKKSQTQVKGFEGQMSQLGKNAGLKTLGSNVIKMGGALGAAIGVAGGAMETFNGIMRSNQATSDAWDNAIFSAKESVNQFFYAIGTGDWSAFEGGILNMMSRFKDLSAMIDEFNDMNLSFGYIRAKDTKEIEHYEAIVRDTSKTQEERQAAFNKLLEHSANLESKLTQMRDKQKDILEKEYNIRSGMKVQMEDMEYFLENTNFSGQLTTEATNAYNQLIKLEKEAKSKSANAQYVIKNKGYDPNNKTIKASQDAKEALDLFKQQNSELIKQGYLATLNDESRKKLVDLLTQQLNKEKELESIRKRTTRLSNSLNKLDEKNTKTGTTIKTDIVYNSGSIGNIDSQISELKKQFAEATDTATRLGIQQAIDELNKQKKWIELEGKVNIKLDIPKYDVTNLIKKTDSKPKEKTKGQTKIDEKIASGEINIGNDFAAVTEIIAKYNQEQLKAIELQNQWVTGIGATADGFQTLSTALSQVAGENDAAARTAKVLMIVSQGLAAATAIVEATKTGFPAMLIAIPAALAAVVGAFATAGSFENGGIVGGNSYSGDRLTAKVNSSEMILNRQQQSNLFNMINSGKSPNSNSLGGNVKFQIEGKSLVGVLNNYSNKKSKY